jgi:DNA-directed RNA polymerase specialized sigma24 family protein
MPGVVRVMIAELEELYRSRRPEFCRAAAAIAGDRSLGEEAVQDAFAKAVRKRRSFKGQGSLEAWVWRIVVNSARDARRRGSGLAGPGEPPPSSRVVEANGHLGTLPFELLTERQRKCSSSTGRDWWPDTPVDNDTVTSSPRDR